MQQYGVIWRQVIPHNEQQFRPGTYVERSNHIRCHDTEAPKPEERNANYPTTIEALQQHARTRRQSTTAIITRRCSNCIAGSAAGDI